MFGGGGGLNPRKLQQMMEQMGIDVEELDATSVVIRLGDGRELVFEAPDVTKMEARGQETYQIIGEPEERDAQPETETETGEAEAGGGGGEAIPDSDVSLVMDRAGVDAETAREALAAADGDLAAAISRLE